jgi:hypothetical protein
MQDEDMDVDNSNSLKPLEPLEKATVYFYKSDDAVHGISDTIIVPKTSNLPSVLEKLAVVFSPIKRKYFIVFIYMFWF